MGQPPEKIKICCNYGTLNDIASLSAKKAFIVTNMLMVLTGYAVRVKNLLEQTGVSCTLFDRVPSDLSMAVVKKGILSMEPGTDLVIALGSDSVIDAAKAILLFSHKALASLTKPLLAVIPTSAGAKSAVTGAFDATDDNNGIKIYLKDELMIPDMAILEAGFTKTAPSLIIATDGMELLAGLVETYAFKKTDSQTESYLEKAITYIFKYLIRSFKRGDDGEAREGMLLASCLGGMTGNDMKSGLASCLADALNHRFQICHGRALALVLPHVIKFNHCEAGARYNAISNLLGLPCPAQDAQSSRSLIYAHEWLCRHIEIPLRVRELGIDENRYFTAVEPMIRQIQSNLFISDNQRCPGKQELRMLLKQLY